MLTLGFGSVQFVTMALALRVGEPVFAAIGATIGGAVIVVAALALGETNVAPLRRRPVRAGVGAVLAIAASIAALSALRLI